MDRGAHLAAIQHHGDLIASCADGSMDAVVEACAPWRVADVVWHAGWVHHFWTELLVGAAPDPRGVRAISRPDDDALLDWYRGALGAAVRALGGAPADSSSWSWLGPVGRDWVCRRVAHETLVHCWDVASAAGAPLDVDAALASDGIDEFCVNFLPNARETALPIGGSVHIHCTDTDGEWLIAPGDGLELVVTREHAKGACALRGPAAALLLVLWRRLPLESVEVIGNELVAEKFVSRASL